MDKWTLLFDVGRCTNCNNCRLATQDEHVGNSFPGYSAAMAANGHAWIEIHTNERGQGDMVDVAYLAVMCQHCADPPCAAAAPPGAVRRRPDGIVLIDPDLSRGCKSMVEACPYGAIHWNEIEEVPQHWNFDAHLIDQGWTAPRAAQACPTGAMRALKMSDQEYESLLATGTVSDLRPALKSRPRVLYQNLKRFTSAFVGGTIVQNVGGVEECKPGVPVRLLKEGVLVGQTESDVFGDFKIQNLNPSPAELVLCLGDSDVVSRRFKLEQSLYLGVIQLAETT
ncbi:4Fe-4S dicluster domain-containing protein [Bradyrhizobium sp. STM 3561]|uniref:4Fe-4S dicluster domain-containing protein n=1 Tax=unclassified Bradyrhizobium TaxID=2631580 RepID=UPI00388D0756